MHMRGGLVTARSTALVTGASSGIGRAFACRLAAQGYDLVVVARRADQLELLADELTSAHGRQVLVVAEDLSAPGAAGRVALALHERGLTVDVLVNDAGTVTFGEFDQLDLQQELAMLQVNVGAAVELTHHVLGHMKARRQGTVFFLSGAMVYLPMPYYATYRATKAFLATFAHGLRLELEEYGVQVVALFPWLTRTDFQKPLGFDVETMGVPFLRTPDDVAASALASVGKRTIVRDGGFNRVVYGLSRVLPERALRTMIKPPATPAGPIGD
jgi:uncharacterized protein